MQSDSPANVETVIADEMFLIRSIHCCCTYRLFDETVLKAILKQTVHCADISFDVYESPSLKDSKRQYRCDDQSERQFSIASQQVISIN